jgi:hypothetical protein
MHPASRRTRSCHAVADMVPSNLPPEVRDDIVQFIFMALLEGSLRRDEVKARIGQFVKEHNREANKHDTGKYGLISLDAPIFADGSTNPGRHNQPRPLGLDARGGPKVDGTARQSLSRQVAQHGLAGLFGLSQRFEGRAADLDRARFLMMDRTPGRHEAGSSVKAGTVAALIADHERKALAAPAPYFHVRDGTNDAGELHGPFPPPTYVLGWICRRSNALAKMVSSATAGLFAAQLRADSKTGRGFAGGVPASFRTGAAADSAAGFLARAGASQAGYFSNQFSRARSTRND